MRISIVFSLCCIVLLSSGCAVTSKSNTARTASEQVLLSSAIDRSLSNVHFEQLAHHAVFINEKYLDSVDKGYLVGSIRHKILAAGGKIAADEASADVVLEVRSGGIGTDMEQSFVGIPALGVPGLPIELPEIKLISKDTQKGTAKIGIIAFNPKTGAAVGLGGESTALADNENMYVLGVGPFKSGAVKDQMENAVGAKQPSSLSKALGVQSSNRMRARPVSLVDGRAIMPETPQVAEFSGAKKIPMVPVTHRTKGK